MTERVKIGKIVALKITVMKQDIPQVDEMRERAIADKRRTQQMHVPNHT